MSKVKIIITGGVLLAGILTAGITAVYSKDCETVSVNGGCLSQQEYKTLKKELYDHIKQIKTDVNGGKYEIDINYLPLFNAVWEQETKNGETLKGKNKQEIKQELVNLLK